MRKVKRINDTGKAPLLTKDQVLKWIPISESTLHRYLNAGKLRAYKLDGLLVFNPAEVEAFLRRRSVGGGPILPFKDIDLIGLRAATDEEAQEFFEGVQRTEDGTLIDPTEDWSTLLE